MIKSLDPLRAYLVESTARLFSRSGDFASLIVLMYHRVLRDPDPLLPDEPDALSFAAQMDLIRHHFSPLPLAEGLRRASEGSLPSRAVCITFDDGYASNADIALPVLAARNLPATVFVAPGFLSGGRMFNDTVIEAVRRAPAELDLRDLGFDVFRLESCESRVALISRLLAGIKYLPFEERTRVADTIADRVGNNLPTDLMMTEGQVRHLHAAGIEIGAHTMHHPILARTDDDSARREIGESRTRLEEIVGDRVSSFAYPNGRPGRDYTARDVRFVHDSGFARAVSTAWGAMTASGDPLQIPRIAPWDRTAFRFSIRLAYAFRQRSPDVT